MELIQKERMYNRTYARLLIVKRLYRDLLLEKERILADIPKRVPGKTDNDFFLSCTVM
jgi:hypothetical protein